jgi:hypothetical protein
MRRRRGEKAIILLTFRSIITRLLPGDRPNRNQVAATGYLHLTVHAKANIALFLAERNIVPGHLFRTELGIRHGGHRKDCSGS